MIDIVIVSCERLDFTKKSVTMLHERTRTPYKLIVVDNGSADGSAEWLVDALGEGLVDELLLLDENCGIHWAWNAGLDMVDSARFVTTDNDIICPDLEPDWLSQLISLMDRNPDFGSISLRPQVFVGGIPGWSDDCEVVEVPWAGAVLRIMRTDVVKDAGGWERIKRKGRDSEERWIAGRLHEAGYKVGIARDIFAWHMFGKAWGYKNLSIEDQGHRRMSPPSEHYDNIRVDRLTLHPNPDGILMKELLNY